MKIIKAIFALLLLTVGGVFYLNQNNSNETNSSKKISPQTVKKLGKDFGGNSNLFLIGWNILQKEALDLIILDVILPKIDGLELLNQFREVSQIPIIMLTALDDEYTQVVNYSSVIDDYVTKPFSPNILVKRVEAVLRRNRQQDETRKKITYGAIMIDLDACLVIKQAGIVNLTKKEYDIFTKLVKSRGKVVTREQLINQIWSYDYNPYDRIIDTHIKNIRKKRSGISIRIVKSTGYAIEEVL